MRGRSTGEGDFPIVTRRVQSRLGIRTRGDVAAIAVRKLAFVPCERPIIVRSRVERRHECCANIHATTAMGVLNGVISEVFDHAAQLFPVGHGYRHVRIGLRGKRNILIGGYWVERLFNESKQVNKIYWLDKQLRLASAFEMVRMLFTKLRSSVPFASISAMDSCVFSSRFGFSSSKRAKARIEVSGVRSS